MDGTINYTPLDPERLTPKKKGFKLSNKVLIGLILFFTVGVGSFGYLLTREKFQTRVPAQVEPTSAVTPIPSPAESITPSGETPTVTLPEPTVTEEANATATAGLVETPSLTPTQIPTIEPTETETPVPTATERPIGGTSSDDPTATPTEIVLVQATATPGEEATKVPQVSEIPSAGISTYSTLFAVVSLTVIFLGLIL